MISMLTAMARELSIVPYLQSYLPPLEKWLAHPVPELSLWGTGQVSRNREKHQG
jgi:hypothetical protein